MDDMQTIQIPGTGNFQFSATRLENVADAPVEYTLITIVTDMSQSTEDFADDLLKMNIAIVEACKSNPKAETLLLRSLMFNTIVQEIHGFKFLNTINPTDYKQFIPEGRTALYDATYSAVGAMITMAKNLSAQEFTVRGGVYIITDGVDNESTMSPQNIAKMIEEASKEEYMERPTTVIIGLHDPEATSRWSSTVKEYLEKLQIEAKIEHFLNVGEATPDNIARLHNWISSSISSTSMGIQSQPANF